MRRSAKKISACLLSATLAVAASPCPCAALASRAQGSAEVPLKVPGFVRLNAYSPTGAPSLAAAPLSLRAWSLTNTAIAGLGAQVLVPAQALAQRAAEATLFTPAIALQGSPETREGRALEGFFENPSLEKVRSRNAAEEETGLEELYQGRPQAPAAEDEAALIARIPALIEDELQDLAPKLLGRALGPQEAGAVAAETSVRPVRWYHYLTPDQEPAASEGITRSDKSIELRLHRGWQAYPSVENHFRAVFAHEYVHRLQLEGTWTRAYGAEAGPVAVHLLRAIELSGLKGLESGTFSFVRSGILKAFQEGRRWASAGEQTRETAFYSDGFLAGAAFELAQASGRWGDSWDFLRRVFSAESAQKPQEALASLRSGRPAPGARQAPPPRSIPRLRGTLKRAAAALVAVAMLAAHRPELGATEPESAPPSPALGQTLQEGSNPLRLLLGALGKAGYYVGNATGFIFPFFQIRRAFSDGNAKGVPVWETLLGVLASTALAINATALGHAFWGVQNIFGALALIAPIVIGKWLSHRRASPNASWLKALLASAAILGASVAVYAAAAAVLPGVLGALFAGHEAITVALQLTAALLFLCMFLPPIISVLRGQVPKGFTQLFSLCFSVGGITMAVWCLDQALAAQSRAQLAQFLIYGASQLTLAAVSFASYLLIRKQEKGKPLA